MSESLSVIIPIYNELDNLDTLLDQLLNCLENLDHSFDILFVNDGSTDGSTEKLNDLSTQDDRIKVIHFARNFGQTAAMMAGIDAATGDILIPMDGDLQNDPDDIPHLLAELDKGNDVVSGWRKDRKDASLRRNFPSRVANWLISWISGVHLHDYGCTLKVYRRKVLKGVRLYGEMHRFIPIYSYWQGGKITEIPVAHRARVAGKSNYGLERTIKVLLDLLVVKFLQKYGQKPIYVFGTFGIFSMGLSFLPFLLMIYYKFFENKSFIETPLPLLVILLFMIGTQSILIGLVAEIVMRTYYESQGKTTYVIDSTINIEDS